MVKSLGLYSKSSLDRVTMFTVCRLFLGVGRGTLAATERNSTQSSTTRALFFEFLLGFY